MADVFLSYARASLNDTMRIADCLRAAGYCPHSSSNDWQARCAMSPARLPAA